MKGRIYVSEKKENGGLEGGDLTPGSPLKCASLGLTWLLSRGISQNPGKQVLERVRAAG